MQSVNGGSFHKNAHTQTQTHHSMSVLWVLTRSHQCDLSYIRQMSSMHRSAYGAVLCMCRLGQHLCYCCCRHLYTCRTPCTVAAHIRRKSIEIFKHLCALNSCRSWLRLRFGRKNIKLLFFSGGIKSWYNTNRYFNWSPISFRFTRV